MTEKKPEQKEEKDSTKKEPLSKEKMLIGTAIGIVLIILILVLGIKYYNPSEKVPVLKYNGFLFHQKAGFWHFDWKKNDSIVYTISLRFNPVEAAEAKLVGDSLDEFNKFIRENNVVFITFYPLANNFTYTTLAAGELSLSVARALDIIPYAACTVNETETCKDRPIVTCDSTSAAVIYLDHEEDKTQIEQKGNCLIISGRGLEKLRAVDRVLYSWYKIY